MSYFGQAHLQSLQLCSAYLVFWALKTLLNYRSYSPIHTLMAKATMQDAIHMHSAMWGSVCCPRMLLPIFGIVNDAPPFLYSMLVSIVPKKINSENTLL